MVENSVKIGTMEEKDLAEQLIREGYSHLYVWEDGPGVEYREHTHRVESAHIILNGEMNMTMNGETKTYPTGDPSDPPPGTVPSPKTVPQHTPYHISTP